jgi:hypothetical protein
MLPVSLLNVYQNHTAPRVYISRLYLFIIIICLFNFGELRHSSSRLYNVEIVIQCQNTVYIHTNIRWVGIPGDLWYGNDEASYKIQTGNIVSLVYRHPNIIYHLILFNKQAVNRFKSICQASSHCLSGKSAFSCKHTSSS